MRKKVIDYCGLEITDEVISRIKDISLSRYDENIYKEYFSSIFNVTDLCKMHETNTLEEHVVLGED